MYEISKEFHFSASHRLDGLRPNHPCGRMHGHNYIVRVILRGDSVNQDGFLLDYNDLKPFGEWLDEVCDHHHLNDVLDMQPSAENMARMFADIVQEVVNVPLGVTVCVSVSETPKTWATWTP